MQTSAPKAAPTRFSAAAAGAFGSAPDVGADANVHSVAMDGMQAAMNGSDRGRRGAKGPATVLAHAAVRPVFNPAGSSQSRTAARDALFASLLADRDVAGVDYAAGGGY